MRKLLTILFVIICQVSFGQVYQIMPQYGYSAPRFNTDSTLQLPTFNGVPTLKSNKTNKGAIAIDSTNGRFYFYNPKTSAWSQVSGGSTDTTSLSNRINLKIDSLKKSNDTIYYYANDNRSFAYKDSIGSTSATRLTTQVYNNSGSTITKGSVIYINGRHSSNLPTIALAQANTEANSYSTFALVQDDIATSNSGTVIQAGNITNLNLPTSTYSDGQIVYLSPSVAGGITTTKPLAPNHIVKIGTITRAHPTLGTIELKIENGWQLDELSDVQIAAIPADSTILQFSRVDSLWHDVSPLTAIGNRYLKPTDSTIYYSKYRSDTSRTNIYSGINLKLAKSDTSSLSTRIDSKLSKVDTSTLSSRIDLKLDKSMASYTFMANNTTATANATAQTFKDTSGVYTVTPIWTGTTQPSGTTNHSFRYTQIGKMCVITINLLYSSAGSALTIVEMPLPSFCATPADPTGFTSTNDFVYNGSSMIFTSKTMGSTPNSPRLGYMKKTSTGYSLISHYGATGGALIFASCTVTYYTN